MRQSPEHFRLHSWVLTWKSWWSSSQKACTSFTRESGMLNRLAKLLTLD